jgi:hypothetical protein
MKVDTKVVLLFLNKRLFALMLILFHFKGKSKSNFDQFFHRKHRKDLIYLAYNTQITLFRSGKVALISVFSS